MKKYKGYPFGIKGLFLLLSTLFFLFTATFAAPATVAGAVKGNKLVELEFKEASVQDVILILSETTGINIVATQKAAKRKVTLFLKGIGVEAALDTICRTAGLWYRYNKKTGVYVIMTTEEYVKDIIVYRDEITKVFTMRYQNVVVTARVIEAMFVDRVYLDILDDVEDDLEVPDSELGDARTGSGGSGSSTGSGYRGGSSSYRDRGSRDSGYGDDRVRLLPGLDRYEQQGGKAVDEVTSWQIDLMNRLLKKEGGQYGNDLMISEKALTQVHRRSSAPIYVSVNREHNLLFVRTADEKALASIEELVRISDRPTPQVLLEMKVMRISLNDGLTSAFDFSYAGNKQTMPPPDGQAPNPYQPDALTGPKGLFGFMGSNINTGAMIFQLMDDHIRFRMQMLEQEGRINILATPLLLATNNRPAKIFIGRETVMTTGFSESRMQGGIGGIGTYITTPVPDTEVVEIGETLTIVPSINSDRTLFLRLLQESSRPVKGGSVIPVVTGGGVSEAAVDVIEKSTLECTAIAKDGLTVVVGGMISESINKNREKVPFLGDLPGLGFFFSRNVEKKERSELVLLITPHIFITPEEAEAVSRQRIEKLTGRDSRLQEYLDELDSSRLMTGKGKEAMKKLSATSTVMAQPVTSDQEQEFIDLVRVAVWQVRTPGAKGIRNNKMVRPVPVQDSGFGPLLPHETVRARPVGQWTDGRYYVTALEVLNTGEKSIEVRPYDLPGWDAVVVENNVLEAAGKAGDSTYVYVVSSLPFNQAVNKVNKS